MISTTVKFNKDDIDKRNNLLDMYSSEEGQKEIFRMIVDGSIFDIVDSDTKLAVHNYVIMRLSEIGLLDEDKIKACIKYLLKLPAIMDVEQKQKAFDKNIENYLANKPSL